MSRGRKLLIVGLVLAVGFGLAWPFRRTATNNPTKPSAESLAADLGQAKPAASRQSPNQPLQIGSPQPHVVAKMTSLGDQGTGRQKRSGTASFDLANHPALSNPFTPQRTSPVTPSMPPNPPATLESYLPADTQTVHTDSRPAYSTVDPGRVVDAKVDVRHVVQNSDTLEKLAKRYLGDEARALEIFDLNRDLLDNPHLLPIDAELRIPIDLRKRVD